MKRTHFEYAISILLLISLCVTGLLGFVQSQLELRGFLPHRYAAYTTLILATIHVYINGGKLWRPIWRVLWRKRK